MDLGPLIVELQKAFDVFGPQTSIGVVGADGLPVSVKAVNVDNDSVLIILED
jgi:hypothetical protein